MSYNYDSWEQKYVEQGYYPIACGVYKGDIPLNGLWFVEGNPSWLCPVAWRDFIYSMIEYCGVFEIKVEISGNRWPSIVLFAKLEKNHQNINVDGEEDESVEERVALVIKKCREFALKNGAFNPWFEITGYFPFDKEEVIVKAESEGMMSYFYFSLFGYLVRYPNDINIETFNGLMQITCSINHASNVRVKNINGDSGEVLDVSGDFYSYDSNCLDTLESCQRVNDRGEFTSNITLSNEEVVIRTMIDVSRTIDTCEMVEPNIRDMVLGSLNHNESVSGVPCVEHYVVISNGTRLLHYCDALDNFEVFVLPEGWSFTDGISYEMYANRKIFDGNNFDYDDPDIKVIYEILDSRGENKGKV